MIELRSRLRLSGFTALCTGLLLSLFACGSDSTGPSSLDSNAALQSLSLGLGAISDLESPEAAPLNASFSAIAPLLDQINVTIDGTSRTMFGLGLRESFPAGTCAETLFIDPLFPPEPGVCTPPFLGLALVLWQSHAANAPPDRMIFIVGDVGTSSFDNLITSPSDLVLSLVAIYLEGQDSFWISASGALTSQVAATSQSCSIPLPAFAKSATCSIATFDEEGAISFEQLSDVPSTARLNITIPRQTVHGIWQAVTETQPITLPTYQRTLPLPRD